MTENDDNPAEVKNNPTRSMGRRDYPLFSLDEGIRVAKALSDAGGKLHYKTNATLLASAMKMSVSGSFLARVGSARNWGLIEGRGEISVTELGKKLASPMSAEEEIEARLEAYYGIPMFKEMYQVYRNSGLPNKELLANVLERRYEIPNKDKKKVADLVYSIFEDINTLKKGQETEEELNNSTGDDTSTEPFEEIGVVTTHYNLDNIKKSLVLIGKLEAYSEMEPLDKELLRNKLQELSKTTENEVISIITKKVLDSLDEIKPETIRFALSLLSEISVSVQHQFGKPK